MIVSTFRHTTRTLVDNTALWNLFQSLRRSGYKVTHEFSRILPGNKVTFEVFPYPRPEDLEKIKAIMLEIEKQSKGKLHAE